jgi:hypothetical protein
MFFRIEITLGGNFFMGGKSAVLNPFFDSLASYMAVLGGK